MTNFCLTELDMKGDLGRCGKGEKEEEDKGIPKRKGCIHRKIEGGRNGVINTRNGASGGWGCGDGQIKTKTERVISVTNLFKETTFGFSLLVFCFQCNWFLLLSLLVPVVAFLLNCSQDFFSCFNNCDASWYGWLWFFTFVSLLNCLVLYINVVSLFSL